MFPRKPSASSSLYRACNSSQYYYHPHAGFPSLNDLLNGYIINEQIISNICKTIIRISILYYLRISEVLNILIRDVIKPDRVFVHGLKGSHDTIIYLPGLTNQIDNEVGIKQLDRLFNISYNKCYRSCVRAGISYKKLGGTNTMRCHAHRYQVNDLFKNGYTTNQLSDLLKHKSLNSISYYIS